ncbi:hypothetical protein B0H14DRAFT_3594710 [Mycena olivaceomarginata]|nr:hypothetical protein B0H14DRAFT_3594710 [Mycena olivaceomarginata]
MSSGHLIVSPPSLKRRSIHEHLKRYYTLQRPALCPPLPAGKKPRGVIRPRNPTARPETTQAYAYPQPNTTSSPSYTSMANRMTTRSSSLARTPSPVGSESSDFYYDDPVFDSTFTSPPSPCPRTPTTPPPTPQPTRAMSTASIVEITMDERPTTPVPDAVPAKRSKAGKKNKGKKRAAQDTDDDDPFLAADVALAVAASLGQTTVLDHATGGASSSHQLPESPSKRLRTNHGGDAAPAAHQAIPAADSPFLIPIVATATRTAEQPSDAAVTATATAAPVGALAHDAAQTLAAGVIAPATFAAVAAAPALTAAAPATPRAVAATPAPDAAAQNIARRLAHAAEAAPEGPVWRTADQNPPRGSYAPTPPGGFPAVIYSSALLTQGMPPGLMQLYNKVPDPKFFVVVSGGNGATIQTHGLIRVAIGDFINVDPTSFHLGTPPTSENGPSPMLWLVAGLPPPLAQAVLDQPALSSHPITLFTIPFNMPVIGFVGTFGGFTLPNTQGGVDAARDLLQTAIQANGDINEFVRTHRDAFGRQVSADQAWHIFSHSVWSAEWHIFSHSVAVEGMELLINNTITVAWQLSVTPPPTNDHGAWLQLRRLFGRLSVMTALHGTARLQRSYRCHICPSINHPTGLCPFPRLPGWLGPTPDTITALAEASRQAAAKAQELIRGNTAPGPNSSAHRAGGSSGRGNANANNKKARKDGGKGRKGGDAKGKGKRREHDDFF